MPQAAALPHPSPDYDRTLVLAIELSSKSWVLAAQVPGLAQVKAKRTIEPTKEALLEALASYRARAAAAGHQIERVASIYEAGWSGFWLAPWLITPATAPRGRSETRSAGAVLWRSGL